MHLTDLLSAQSVAIQRSKSGEQPLDKHGALDILSGLLATPRAARVSSTAGAAVTAGAASGDPPADALTKGEIEKVLLEREQLQSTGIGEGVAIPHGAMNQLTGQVAALLIVPDGVDFAAIDERKVTIIFGVIGPKRATGEHLKTLARVSRLLRNPAFRDHLVAAETPESVYNLIASEEGESR